MFVSVQPLLLTSQLQVKVGGPGFRAGLILTQGRQEDILKEVLEAVVVEGTVPSLPRHIVCQTIENTVKPAHATTCIKRPPALNGNLSLTATCVKRPPVINDHLH